MTNPLRLKHEEKDEEPPPSACPSCGAALDPEAVICVQCGYDVRAKRRVTEGRPARTNPLLIGGLLLVIVSALAVVFLRARTNDTAPALVVQQAAPPAQSAPPPAEPVPEPPAAPAPEPTPVPAPTSPPDTPAVTAEPAPVEPVEPEKPAVDWDAMQTELRGRAESDLDRRAPLFEPGALVELRTTNGIIQRGVFRAMAEGQLALEVATNDVRRLPLATLDRGTRVRLDADYRARYLDYVVSQRIAEMKKAEATEP